MSSRKASGNAKSKGKRAAKKSVAKKTAKKATAKKATAKKPGNAKAPKKATVKKAAPRPFISTLTAAEKREIVERYIGAYNDRDTASILALYDQRAKMEDPIGLPPAVGHKAIAGLYQMGFDMGVTIAHDGAVRIAGNEVAFPLIASSATSRLDVIDVFEFGPGNKIVRMRAYWGPDNLQGDLAVRQ